MEYSFRKEAGGADGLRLDLDEGFVLDTFALRMMNHNNLVHFVPVDLVQWDSERYLQYDTNGMKLLSEKIWKTLNKRDILLLFGNVIEAFEEMENHMLSEDVIVMDMEYVYIDRAEQCRFLCVPCKRKNEEEPLLFLRRLTEYLNLHCEGMHFDTQLSELADVFSGDTIRTLADAKEFLCKMENGVPRMEGKIGGTDNVIDRGVFVKPRKPGTGKNTVPESGKGGKQEPLGQEEKSEEEDGLKLPESGRKVKEKPSIDLGYILLGAGAILSNTGKEKKPAKPGKEKKPAKPGKVKKEVRQSFEIPGYGEKELSNDGQETGTEESSME